MPELMNRYGLMAMHHWAQHAPRRYAAIVDRETFFTTLGADAEMEITALADRLAGPDRPGETSEEKWARLNTAKAMAESDLLRELPILIPAEDQENSGTASESHQLLSDLAQAYREIDDEDWEDQLRHEQ